MMAAAGTSSSSPAQRTRRACSSLSPPVHRAMAPSPACDAGDDAAPSSFPTSRGLHQQKETGGLMIPTQQLQEFGGPSLSKHKRPATTNLQPTAKRGDQAHEPAIRPDAQARVAEQAAAAEDERQGDGDVVQDPQARGGAQPQEISQHQMQEGGGPSGSSPQLQKRPAPKRVRSHAASQSNAKRRRSSKVAMQVGTPVVTRSPMMRLLVSPVVVGVRSPAQQAHHVQRSPSRSPTPPNIHADTSTRGSKPRKLRSTIWKDIEPIYQNGKLVRGRCKHCNELFDAARKSGTSHIKRHIESCEERAKIQDMVQQLQSTTPDEAALSDWKFDAERTRGELVRMIVLHELPFYFVEYDGFIRYSASLNPVFKVVYRTTIKMDCMEAFKNNRSVLRDKLKDCNSRVSLTADAWTSKGNIGYFCITCHYIDDKWKVQKLIIRFCYIKTPHDASNLYNVMLKSIHYYNIEDKLFSVTLDNAQTNTTMVNSLCEYLFTRELIPSGDLFHVQCAAHVLNLIVKDGLQTLEGVIDNVRESVKYIKASQSRKEKFEEIIADLGISCKKRPSLDVPTRWNSTYLMLKSALPLREAYLELQKQDLNYSNCPLSVEWDRAEVVCNLLKVFKRGTKIVSGTKYPTSNLYFHQIWEVRQALKEGALSTNATITSMVKGMQMKFDKYWKFSYLTNCIPVVLDPGSNLHLLTSV